MSSETDFTGRTVGRYRIISLLGQGGMGAVYRAYDAALERHVAIKILPPDLVTDSDRVTRFVQEAKAASGLNHPHVVAIHDIGTEDSTHYIAMELIEGETLREKLRHGRLELRKAVTIVSQIADALAAAHAAGIVHRDLKPENVMVASSGYVKILDFGLAKLRGAPAASSGGDTATAIKGTEPGKVMGTVGYMAPEQAQGKEIDHRADIFALGCILFELSTGISPFRGNSSIDTLHKILYSDPEPLRTHLPNAPMELQWILRKALAKDPEDRYQSAKDMAIDLRDLVRELESNPSGTSIAAISGARTKMSWVLGLLTVAILASLVVWIVSKRDTVDAQKPDTPLQLKMSRITSSGKVISAAISPDARFISYVVSDQGEQSLWIRQLSSAQGIQLVPPDRVGFWSNVFTPDGNSIIYATKGPDDPKGSFYLIPTLGGTPRKIISDIEGPPSFSPDGKQMVWIRDQYPTPPESAVVIANVDGTGLRLLAKRTAPEFFSRIFFGGPSWSPDGKKIATSVFVSEKARGGKVIEIDVATGTQRVLVDRGFSFTAQVGWLPDGSGLLMIAQSDLQSSDQVWHAPYPTGDPRPITNDLLDYRIISLSRDAKSLVTVAQDAKSDIWSVPLDRSARGVKLTSGKLDGLNGLSVSRDGRIAYVSIESGTFEIWIMDGDGGGKRQLTFDKQENRWPLVTPDGKSVLYVSTSKEGTSLCKIGIDDATRSVLAQHIVSDPVAITPDGRSVFFHTRGQLMRVSIDGGPISEVTKYPAVRPAVSPDGTRLASICRESASAPAYLCITSIDGSTAGKTLVAGEQRLGLAAYSNYTMLRWSQDGKSILTTTMPNDRANLWSIPIDGAPPKRLTDFDERLLFRFDISADGKQLIYSRGDLSRDAVLITGFR